MEKRLICSLYTNEIFYTFYVYLLSFLLIWYTLGLDTFIIDIVDPRKGRSEKKIHVHGCITTRTNIHIKGWIDSRRTCVSVIHVKLKFCCAEGEELSNYYERRKERYRTLV